MNLELRDKSINCDCNFGYFHEFPDCVCKKIILERIKNYKNLYLKK
jgi:hypothetical protein